MDLSKIWDFKLDDGNGFEQEWYKAPMTMAVPSSYLIRLKQGESV